MTGFSEASKKHRKTLANIAIKQLSLAEELLSEIISSYPDEQISAAHPKSGAMQTLRRLREVKKETGLIK